MKKQLLAFFITICLSNFVTAQSISFTSSPLTTAEIGSTITVNYQYTTPANGNIYCAINLYNDFTWSSMVVEGVLSPAPAGTNMTGSFNFTIPNGTTPTANLTGNFNYKIVIELSNASWAWQAGSYPTNQINLTAPAVPTGISFTSAPLTTAEIGTTIPISYQYSIPNSGKIYCAIELLDGFTYQSTVVSSLLDPVAAGTNVPGTFNFAIPSGTTPTANLTGNLNYKIKIELLNSAGGYLAGQFPATQINFTPNLSTSDFENNSISVYPNPTNDFIYVKGIENTPIDQVTVFDMLGKKCLLPLN